MDPCAINNGGCSHDCVEGDGKAQCSCPVTMELLEDGKTCEGMNVKLDYVILHVLY